MAVNIPPQYDKKDKNPQTTKGGVWVTRDAHTGKFLDVKMRDGTKFDQNLRRKAMEVIIKLKDK
jgi:hypothetical protein